MMLCGTGWTDWQRLRGMIDGWQAVWVDLDGPHLGPVPQDMPGSATHLWAWSSDCWVRARLDDGDVVAGFLHPESECPSGGDCREASVSPVRLAATWAEPHIATASLHDQRWEVVDLLDGVAATFVRAAGPAASA